MVADDAKRYRSECVSDLRVSTTPRLRKFDVAHFTCNLLSSSLSLSLSCRSPSWALCVKGRSRINMDRALDYDSIRPFSRVACRTLDVSVGLDSIF